MRTKLRLAAIAVLLALAAASCAPNEAVVCKSTSTGTGPSCGAEYELCAGGTDRVECAPSQGGVTCSCIENGTTKRTFVSADACNVSFDTLKKRAAENCNWSLGED